MTTMQHDPVIGTGTDLVHAPAGGAIAAMSVEGAQAAMELYREMCQALLTPEDMQAVDDKEFVKRSGFQKLAAAYGVSTEILSLDVERDVPSEDGPIMVARARVRAIHPAGRHAEGDGACASNEKRFRKGDQRIEHNLPATAVTRATNRAISNLIAFGTVSAEEAETGAAREGNVRVPAWAAPVPDVGAVAKQLVDLLALAGVDEPEKKIASVGQAIFDECDQQIPVCVAHVIEHIADAIRGGTETEVVDAVKEAFDATEEGAAA